MNLALGNEIQGIDLGNASGAALFGNFAIGASGQNIITGEILPFPGLSRLSYNYSLYFENERFGARASYNWREKWLVTASGRDGCATCSRWSG